MDTMNIHKHGASWRCRFVSHQGKTCKLRLARNKRVAEAMARKVASLVDHAAAGALLDDTLLDWIGSLDSKRVSKLAQWGLVDEKQMAAKESLEQQMNHWLDGLLARGRSDSEANKRHRRALTVAEACRWKNWRDIDPEQVLNCIDQWRRDGKVPGFNRKSTVSERTLNHYFASIKQFTRWVYRFGYATKDPLAVLSIERRPAKASAILSNMAKRRPLTDSEQRQLIAAAQNGPVRHNMAGEDRSLLYRVALQTGLRASAIRRLRCGDVDASGWLLACGGGAANKKTTPKPIRGTLLAMLIEHVNFRMADVPLFTLPPSCEMARMLRADCKAAGINTEGVDFHALRHTFGTTLARQGVHPKTLMSLLDHSSINMTMRLYTHSMPEDEQTAMGLLPSLDSISEPDQDDEAAEQ